MKRMKKIILVEFKQRAKEKKIFFFLSASLFNVLQFIDLVNKKLITSAIYCGDPHYIE